MKRGQNPMRHVEADIIGGKQFETGHIGQAKIKIPFAQIRW